MPYKTRILSDIHFGHKASIVKEIDQLEELCQGVDHLIFNGDTIEQKYADSPKHAQNPLPTFQEFSSKVANWSSSTLYISGNHDPSISRNHFYETQDRSVFVTHGDGLFESIAPWSSNAAELEIAVEKRQKNGRGKNLQEELQLLKDASVDAHEAAINYDPTAFGKAFVFLAQAWPPTRPFTILNAWKQTPERAVALAHRHGRNPKVIIIGHTHFPGIWNHDGIWVINTGSFFPWPTRYAVDIERSTVTVRKIVKSKNRFRLGTVRKTIEL